MSFFKIVVRDGEMLADANTFDQVAELIRRTPVGPYHIDEMSLTLLPSGQTARRWRFFVRHLDGRVVLEPDQCERRGPAGCQIALKKPCHLPANLAAIRVRSFSRENRSDTNWGPSTFPRYQRVGGSVDSPFELNATSVRR